MAPGNERRNLTAWLALHLLPGVGGVVCRRLAEHCGGPGEVLAAAPEKLARVPGLRKSALAALTGRDRGELLAAAAQELRRAEQQGVGIISLEHPDYPVGLRNIADPPIILYLKGDFSLLGRPTLAIVGSRAATSYGLSMAGRLAADLSRRGVVIASGLALGIDTGAHRGALAAGGKTVAVLGCGPDVIYPPSNHRLFAAIAERGLLVSEYPFGTRPESFRFPSRNRIISGLSLGVLVVEATRNSGSLITAGHALEQGREVFAVPGRVDSVKSAGTHGLLQQGAKLVHSVADILEELPPVGKTSRSDGEGSAETASLTSEEKELLAVLEVYPRPIDEIVRQADLSAQKVSELLLLLEMKGAVEALPGKNFRRMA